MEQQSDNNLDTLFQKAAEEYPLKTNNKNWDIVAAKLQTSTIASSANKSKKWQYTTLLLLFLLAGSFFIINSLNKHATSLSQKQDSLSQKNKSDDEQQNQNKNAKPQLPKIIERSDNLTRINRASKTPIYSANKTISFKHSEQKNSELLTKENNNSLALTQSASQPKLSADNSNSELNQSKNNIPAITDKNITQNSDKINKSVNTANKKSKHVSLRPQPKTFYGTFFFSPDFSTIKFQHINKPGYSIGVALGYRITNRISAEIGLQRVHANFYSDGKYFDTSNIKIKPSTTLDDLNGNNKLTEIPVALRYNLFKNNYHFFATGGTTVAVITHAEKYDYNVIKNGAPKDIYKKFSALTGTKFFSSINLSLGYETSVSNLFDVKVEPYFQAATKGLGIGNLPVSNFGVNIGIIKDLK